MRIILECSHQYNNTIKRKLNNHFDQIKYVNKNDDEIDFVIKEFNSLKDIKDIKKNIINKNMICLINSNEFMFELLEFKPIAFIRTQFIDKDLEELIQCIEYRLQGHDMILDFQSGHQIVRINVKNIIFVESYAHYLLIHTMNATIKVREKISNAINKLEPFGFIQIHRSYLINKNFIKNIDSQEICMKDMTIIPISKKYKHELKKIKL